MAGWVDPREKENKKMLISIRFHKGETRKCSRGLFCASVSAPATLLAKTRPVFSRSRLLYCSKSRPLPLSPIDNSESPPSKKTLVASQDTEAKNARGYKIQGTSPRLLDGRCCLTRDHFDGHGDMWAQTTNNDTTQALVSSYTRPARPALLQEEFRAPIGAPTRNPLPPWTSTQTLATSRGARDVNTSRKTRKNQRVARTRTSKRTPE